ncbi:SLC13 family permease [Zavarzinia sp. CC-PAN008]|uniref:SLC13 family permease n=1 Tax=Zavarzinia sp. CC-PAN008 TaxID=3243332 RepID=UPI003F7442FD
MSDLALVLVLLAAAIAMFAFGRPRMDVVALLMVVALPLAGLVTVPQALAGFSDPNVILIAALFVVGEALVRTGVAQKLGDWLVRRAGRSEGRLIALLMISVAGIGAFMSSTGVVAIFVPIVLRIARNAGIAARRLMMPLSMAALLSGMMTLVATAPNLVVHGELVREGQAGFGFFAFTPFGVPLLILAIGYMLLARRMLGDGAAPQADSGRPTLRDFVEAYGLRGRDYRLAIGPASLLAGRELRELDLRGSAGINIVALERATRFGSTLLRPEASLRLEAGDVLLIDSRQPGSDMAAVVERFGLRPLALEAGYFQDRAQAIGMAEVLVPPESRLVGRSVVEAKFRSTHDLAVIGLRRGSTPHAGTVTDVALRPGDALLVIGPWRSIRRLPQSADRLILLNMPVEHDDIVARPDRAPHALAILVLTVGLMASGVVPNVLAALIGCLLFGLAGCIDMTSAYRSIHWQTLVLIVGMLPFSAALQATGGVGLAADALVAAVGGAAPRVVLAALFLLTAVLGLFISNTATAVLMAPVAIALAGVLDASPYPFAMTVALAASAAFMTPVSSPVNTLVVGPGNYGFMDFVKVGVPFTLITLGVCVTLVPILFPFAPH